MMFRIFFLTVLLLLPLQSIAATSYTINIAVYKNIHTLNVKLDKLSPALRKTIEVKQRNKRYFAKTLPTEDKKMLQKLLPSYKKVFSDAFIAPVKLK